MRVLMNDKTQENAGNGNTDPFRWKISLPMLTLTTNTSPDLKPRAISLEGAALDDLFRFFASSPDP